MPGARGARAQIRARLCHAALPVPRRRTATGRARARTPSASTTTRSGRSCSSRWSSRPIDGGERWMTPLAHRQFYPQELEALLHYNGFEITERSGGRRPDEQQTDQSRRHRHAPAAMVETPWKGRGAAETPEQNREAVSRRPEVLWPIGRSGHALTCPATRSGQQWGGPLVLRGGGRGSSRCAAACLEPPQTPM